MIGGGGKAGVADSESFTRVLCAAAGLTTFTGFLGALGARPLELNVGQCFLQF